MYCLCFCFTQQSGIVVTETLWLTKLKTFIILSLKEKYCWLLEVRELILPLRNTVAVGLRVRTLQ